MLDAYIIDAIRREEQRRREIAESGRRLWIETPMMPAPSPRGQEEEREEGPIVIPLHPDDAPESGEDAA